MPSCRKSAVSLALLVTVMGGINATLQLMPDVSMADYRHLPMHLNDRYKRRPRETLPAWQHAEMAFTHSIEL